MSDSKDDEDIEGRAFDLKDRICPLPFTSLDVYGSGAAHFCCRDWLPKSMGTLLKDGEEDVFNSDQAQEIRASILDGSYRYCNHKVCPKISGRRLPLKSEVDDPFLKKVVAESLTHIDDGPRRITLNYDRSCNLECPSCRSSKISHTRGPMYERARTIHNRLMDQVLERAKKQWTTLLITGTGDPFGSKIFRDFLFSLDAKQYPQLGIDLLTNGVMLTPSYWNRLGAVANKIGFLGVSIDAATPETYAALRKGGDWKQLQKNLRFFAWLRRKGLLRDFRLYCVVQKANYRELPQLVALGKELGCDEVRLDSIMNWNVWGAERFQEMAVWQESHPEFPDLVKVLQDPCFDEEFVFLGNLRPIGESGMRS